MDQLKIVLAVLKKHHFWVLCGLTLLILPPWWLGTHNVAKTVDDREKKIDGQLKKMISIDQVPNHPNREVIDKIDGKTNDLKEKVLAIWGKCYEEQKKKNRLPDTLTGKFKDYFEEDEDIPLGYREEYRAFIKGYFKKLFEEELNVLRPNEATADDAAAGGTAAANTARNRLGRGPATGTGTGAGNLAATHGGTGAAARRGTGPTAGSDDMIGIVEWAAADRALLQDRFKWEDHVPSTQEVRDAQEDLWVIEALVRIIKNCNEGATGNYNATIRRIDSLAIGQDAVRDWMSSAESVVRLDTKGALDAKDVSGARYVDDDGNPLAPDASPPYAEFNMMPICMRLYMDQLKIPKLLVECANSDMPVEVRAVLVQPGTGTPLDLTQLSTGSGGGHTLTSGGASSQVAGTAPATSLYVPVEIQGIICIYNRPDKDKLGTGTPAKGSADTAAAPRTPLAIYTSKLQGHAAYSG